MTTEKTIALTRQTFVGKVMSLLLEITKKTEILSKEMETIKRNSLRILDLEDTISEIKK